MGTVLPGVVPDQRKWGIVFKPVILVERHPGVIPFILHVVEASHTIVLSRCQHDQQLGIGICLAGPCSSQHQLHLPSVLIPPWTCLPIAHSSPTRPPIPHPGFCQTGLRIPKTRSVCPRLSLIHISEPTRP